MGQAAAKEGDTITATDTHMETPPGSGPVPVPHDFNGTIDAKVSQTVMIEGRGAATEGSMATNNPPHVFKTGPFSNPPRNQGKITRGSSTVKIEGLAAARNGDTAETCNDPADLPVGTVNASGSVMIGE